MKEKKRYLPHDFTVGNMSQDLMLSIFRLCGKKEEKTNFPKILYSNYVDTMTKAVIQINQTLLTANESHDDNIRLQKIGEAMGELKHLDDLLYTAVTAGWISDKQYEGRAKLIASVYWKTLFWRKGCIEK